MSKPIPVPDELTKPFWDAVNERRLVAQHCVDCSNYQHPPARTCVQCGGSKLEFRPLSGKGTIYTLQVMHDTRVRLLQEYQPLIIATIEAVESPNVSFLTNLPGTAAQEVAIGAEPGTVHIGDPVEVEFEEVAPGKLLPQFRVVR